MNLLLFRNINKEGMAILGNKYDKMCGIRLLWIESRSMAGDAGGNNIMYT